MYTFPEPDPSNQLALQFHRVTEIYTDHFLNHSKLIEAPHWQSTKALDNMRELHNVNFVVDLRGTQELDRIAEAIRPNLPWADRHFEEERVSGEPINPGETWRIWPYGHSAAKHLREGENVPQYDHSYAERYWPKLAGSTPDGHVFTTDHHPVAIMNGIRFEIGDLDDLVDVLVNDPLTRQAYLPLWFPEDIAAARDGKRVPCTLGYHFILRQDRLHVFYPMRSCDFIRHFRDDVYLTIRLLHWVLEKLKALDPAQWGHVEMGTFAMHMVSLHMFDTDLTNLRNARTANDAS